MLHKWNIHAIGVLLEVLCVHDSLLALGGDYLDNHHTLKSLGQGID